MRHALLASILVLGVSTTASAQTLRVEITDGNFRAGMHAAAEPYKTGGPWAGIPATPLKTGVDPTVTEFRIRAWAEGDGVRVMVFAATVLGSLREAREQQIASLVVPLGKSVDIAATEQFRARRIRLVTEKRELLPYRLQQHGIDIPLRIFPPGR